MLHLLSHVWEKVFESLLKLLTNSIVVHADETTDDFEHFQAKVNAKLQIT